MTPAEARALLLSIFGRIAPDADLSAIDLAADLRDELDIDSMDFLNAMLAVHEQTGIDVPETDYEQLATLESAGAYLASRSTG